MPLTGTFNTMPFVDLLQWIAEARRSGTLSVALEFEERFLRFVEGSIVAWGSDDPVARDVGRLCLERNLIDEPTLHAAIAAQRENQMPLGDVLASQGSVAPEALEEAVRAHVEETVLALFLWPDGRFTFVEPGPITPEQEAWMPPEYELAMPLDTRGVLLEGMRRMDEWERISAALPADDALVVALGPAPDLPILEEIAAHPEPPTLGELLAEKTDRRFTVCEQLHRGMQRGLLAFETGRPRPPRTDPTARGATTVEHLIEAANTLVTEGQHDEAATLLRTAINLDPFRVEARVLIDRSRRAQLTELYALIPRGEVPELLRGPTQRAAASLPPRDRRLLGQVNGRWDVAVLTLTSGMGELETLRALKRLLHAGVIRLASRPA